MKALRGACAACLRRSLLIGRLAPRIAGLLGLPPEKRTSGVLGLACEELIDTLVSAPERAGVRRWLAELDLDKALADMDEAGLDALCLHREPYPEALASAGDAPPVLWILGGRRRLEDALGAPVVTVVGTRKPSPYGREMAYSLGRDLASAGVTVVSGLALGIDAAAHRGALDGGGSPVAVMANGPDVPYPRTNTDLWRRIAERGWCCRSSRPASARIGGAFPHATGSWPRRPS